MQKNIKSNSLALSRMNIRNYRLAVAFYGLVGAFAIGTVGVVGVTIAGSVIPGDPDRYRFAQENALVERYEGADDLSALLASHGFEDNFVRRAIAKQCSSNPAAHARICSDYADISERVEAYAADNREPGWIDPTALGFAATVLASGVGLAIPILRSMRSRNRNTTAA